MRERFSAFVKSMNGSFVNSETWTTCSAVAMAGPSSMCEHPFYFALKRHHKGRTAGVCSVAPPIPACPFPFFWSQHLRPRPFIPPKNLHPLVKHHSHFG